MDMLLEGKAAVSETGASCLEAGLNKVDSTILAPDGGWWPAVGQLRAPPHPTLPQTAASVPAGQL